MKKDVITLAKELDFTTKYEYFDYIVCSMINGQRQQVRNLFNEMDGYDQNDFLNTFLECDNTNHKETKAICIEELIQF